VILGKKQLLKEKIRYYLKGGRNLKKNKGFTLIELIVVIAILAILAAILVPVMLNSVSDANEAVLRANCSGIQSFIKVESMKFDSNHLFKNSADNGNKNLEEQTYFSRYLEVYFEQSGYGKNSFAMRNPYSEKTGILNYESYKLVDAYRQQALVVSNNSNLKYDNTLSLSDGKTYLKGSVIIYLDNGYDYIEIYYIDKDGAKSSTVNIIPLK